MHRIAIGDPQCVRHELFAMLGIWMVDGETVWQELSRGWGSLGLIGCGYCRRLVEVRSCVHVDISSGTRIVKRARFGNARAIIRRARAGATSIVGKDFLPAIAPKSPLLGGAMGVLQIARRWNSAADLPDVSKCFRAIAQSIHASDHHATLHGVVFDILVGSGHRVGLAALLRRIGSRRRTRPWLAIRGGLRLRLQPALRVRHRDANLAPSGGSG